MKLISDPQFYIFGTILAITIIPLNLTLFNLCFFLFTGYWPFLCQMFLMNPFIPLSKQCSSCTDRTDNYTRCLNPHLAQLFPFLPHDRHPLVGQSRSSTCSSPSVAALCAGSSMKLKLKCRSRIWVNSSSYNTVAVDARHNFPASVQGCSWE